MLSIVETTNYKLLELILSQKELFSTKDIINKAKELNINKSENSIQNSINRLKYDGMIIQHGHSNYSIVEM